MQTYSIPQAETMPNYLTKLVMGLLVLTLTLLLLFTAAAPFFSDLFIDEACEAAADSSFDAFSAETAVPDCWLIP